MKFIVRKQTGFTLLEVLIAITITAVIGLGSWQLLNTAIRAYELSQTNLQSLSQLQRAQLNISRDFTQLVPRAIRDEYGDYQSALKTEDGFYLVELTRAGWRNPLQERRSELQRVAYELSDGELLRHHWKVLDRAQDSEPVTRRLLSDVESITVSFLNSSRAWIDEWPPTDLNTNDDQVEDLMKEYAELPLAVRITLVHPRFGEVTRLFDQSSYIENILIQSASGANGGETGTQGDANGTNNVSGGIVDQGNTR